MKFTNMLNITQSQNSNTILFTTDNKVTGTLMDVIEYFTFSHNYNPDLRLIVLASGNFLKIKEMICNTVKFRYHQEDILNAMYIFPKSLFYRIALSIRFRKLFVFDLLTVLLLKQLKIFPSKQIFYITEYTTEKYFLKSKFSKITYVTEMPFCKADIKYRLKFFFDIFPKYKNFDNKLYVNYPLGDISNVKYLIHTSKEILEKQISSDKVDYNIHKKFNEYLYIKSPFWFDTHPRLFHESEFYGKKYSYINRSNIKDGSWYRYYDLKENGLKNRNMSKDDYLINEMIT